MKNGRAGSGDKETCHDTFLRSHTEEKGMQPSHMPLGSLSPLTLGGGRWEDPSPYREKEQHNIFKNIL